MVLKILSIILLKKELFFNMIHLTRFFSEINWIRNEVNGIIICFSVGPSNFCYTCCVLLPGSSHFSYITLRVSMQQFPICNSLVVNSMYEASGSTLVFSVTFPSHVFIQLVTFVSPITVVWYTFFVHLFQNITPEDELSLAK